MTIKFSYSDSTTVTNFGWHQFVLATFDIEEQVALDFMMIEDWCIEQYGDEDKQGRWKCSGWAFWFRRPEDAFEFKMRWM